MNIFLVEDECWALMELEALCKAYEPEHRIYAFDNGDDAYQAALRIRPDLVVTDITMPGMSGLELISRLVELDPTVRAVILTVHDQFSYAQQALRLGVIDYLLKPVKKETFYQTIDEAVRRVQNDENLQQAKVKWLISQLLLKPEPSGSELEGELFREPCFLIEVIVEEGWNTVPPEVKSRMACFPEQAAAGRPCYVVELDASRLAMLLPITGSNAAAVYASELHKWFDEISRQVVMHVGYRIKPVNENLYQVFHQLDKQLHDQMMFARPTWVEPSGSRQEADLDDVWDDVRMLGTHIKKGEILKIKETALHVAAKLSRKPLTRRQLETFVIDAVYSLRYKLLQTPAEMNDADMKLRLEDIHSYEELRGKLEQWFTDLCVRNGSRDSDPKELVPVVINWIQKSYHQNISLRQFANDHHVSLGYLSRLFKLQTGESFSEYLARYRIEKAKEFLAGGVERIRDVCHLVGYDDVKHFSHIFKRMVGETPKVYQKKMIREKRNQ